MEYIPFIIIYVKLYYGDISIRCVIFHKRTSAYHLIIGFVFISDRYCKNKIFTMLTYRYLFV